MVTATLACIVTAVLLSCTQPTEPVVAALHTPPLEEEPEKTAPEVVEEQEPSGSLEIPDNPQPWQAEDGTLYLFYDHAGGELYRSEQPAADRWASRTRAYRQMAERDGYVFVAGRAIE